jgi:methylenetetrahydrofolate--tRNA-(uracil-5-)-methyltransferase
LAHKHQVIIVGGGLAGSEAAWQLAKRGIPVKLYEMRPKVMTKAHKTGELAELVCSNSFRGAALTNAVGLLKEELRLLDSLIMRCGDLHRVPAGGAMAVDRVRFSEEVSKVLRSHPLVEIVEEEMSEIPVATRERPVIIATGPLTSRPLAQEIKKFLGQESLSFFDAISPIVLGESLNLGKVFRQSRYGKGNTDDYLNIPLSKEQYYTFVEEVRLGDKYGGHEEVEADSIENLRPFEGCMPIEDMVERGPETLRFGPFKPVGLRDPETGKTPFAVVQLRQDDKEGELWSMVGMQTRLKHPDQLRIFRSLPGLEEAEFVRLGSVHRNTFIDSPKCLNSTLELRSHPGLFFAGQITGVEGYVESTAGGMVAGINVARIVLGEEPVSFPGDSATGSLMNYISDPTRKDFQPMNISFGLIPSYFEVESQGKKKDRKEERRLACSERALNAIRSGVCRDLSRFAKATAGQVLTL